MIALVESGATIDIFVGSIKVGSNPSRITTTAIFAIRVAIVEILIVSFNNNPVTREFHNTAIASTVTIKSHANTVNIIDWIVLNVIDIVVDNIITPKRIIQLIKIPIATLLDNENLSIGKLPKSAEFSNISSLMELVEAVDIETWVIDGLNCGECFGVLVCVVRAILRVDTSP